MLHSFIFSRSAESSFDFMRQTRDRESFASYENDIQFLIRRLSEHPVDLLEMAGIYSEAEKSATETNAKLQTNQIV